MFPCNTILEIDKSLNYIFTIFMAQAGTNLGVGLWEETGVPEGNPPVNVLHAVCLENVGIATVEQLRYIGNWLIQNKSILIILF